MEARHYISIILVAIGTSLIPIGWMFSPGITLLVFISFVLGLIIFMTQKYIKPAEKDELNYGKHHGTAMPADIHNHSGWGAVAAVPDRKIFRGAVVVDAVAVAMNKL